MQWLALITIFLFSLLLFGFVFFQLLQNVISAPYVPSNRRKVEKLLRELDVQDKTFVDIGSGDGCIVRTAAKLGAQATGVEINPYLSIYSKVRNIFSKHKSNIHYLQKSFFNVDLSSYDVIYIYLYPGLMERLEEKIFSELKPGGIVISNTFVFKDRVEKEVVDKQFNIYTLKAQ